MSKLIEMNVVDKSFGIFVGLYNKVNNSNLSVKQAGTIPEMMNLFNYLDTSLKCIHPVLNEKIQELPVKSTKLRSFEAVDLNGSRLEVFEFIKKNPNLSVRQIAQGLNKTKTFNGVGGRVSELLKLKLIYVSGETESEFTGRAVQIYAVRK